MSSERTRPPYATAEAWINPLLERGRKFDTVEENVEIIRDWVVTGQRIMDKYGNFTYRKSVRKRFEDQRFTYVMVATSEDDPESVDILKNALSIGVVVADVTSDSKKSLDVTFKYDFPDANGESDLEPSPELYCHIAAYGSTTGTIFGTEWRKISELMPNELDMVCELTNSVAGFIPTSTSEQTP